MATPRRGQPGVHLTVDNLQSLKDGINLLSSVEVLVGVPEETTERDDDEKTPLTNAALAYIHDNGAPEVNIPARPFMIPGIQDARAQIVKRLTATASATYRASQVKPGQKRARKQDVNEVIEKGMHAVGLTAQAAIRAKINEGIPPPLSDLTLRRRAARGRKGAAKELDRRAQGVAPGTDLAKPLIDTGELRNSITYAIRKKSDRK